MTGARRPRPNHFLLDHGGSLGTALQRDPPDAATRRRVVRRVASAAVDAADLRELLAALGLEAEEGR